MFQSLFVQLQNPDPNQRKQAVNTLGAIRHPRAREALRFVYRNDPDPGVREAALQYLPGIRAKLGLPPIAPNPSTPVTSRSPIWDCVYCGTRDISGAACPNCGAPRPTSADEKDDIKTPAALSELFQNPPQGMPNTRRQVRQVMRQQRQTRRVVSNLIALVFVLIIDIIRNRLIDVWLKLFETLNKVNPDNVYYC
jgi:hypothetical protein